MYQAKVYLWLMVPPIQYPNGSHSWNVRERYIKEDTKVQESMVQIAFVKGPRSVFDIWRERC